MYAVIASGGKQHKVSAGDQIKLERLDAQIGSEVSFVPLLLVEDGNVISEASQLSNATVKGRIAGQVKGPKIRGFTYKSKSNSSRRWGHRQSYSLVEMLEITK
jgi:large subunit ribosomal protein L21